MRIGIALSDASAGLAGPADEIGAFGVWITGDPRVASVTVAPVVAATRDARIVIDVALGDENPITLAEELTVLDAVNGGRTIALVHTGELDLAGASEDVDLLRRALSGRPIQHRGVRWTVPAGVNENAAAAVMVTPPSTQLEIPIWLTGDVAEELSEAAGVPALRQTPKLTGVLGVQPGTASLSGTLADDLALVRAWMDAGTTHLLLTMPVTADRSFLREYVARHIIPEVAMVDFPRLMAETAVPPIWPGSRQDVAQ